MCWGVSSLAGVLDPTVWAAGSDLGVQRGLLCVAVPLRAHQPQFDGLGLAAEEGEIHRINNAPGLAGQQMWGR